MHRFGVAWILAAPRRSLKPKPGQARASAGCNTDGGLFPSGIPGVLQASSCEPEALVQSHEAFRVEGAVGRLASLSVQLSRCLSYLWAAMAATLPFFSAAPRVAAK